MLPTRHRVPSLTPGRFAPRPTLPWASGGTVCGFYARGWAEGRSGSRPGGLGAVRGADPPASPLLAKWPAGFRGFPSSSQPKPAPRIRWPAGVLKTGSWGSRGSPSPDLGATSLLSALLRPLPLPVSPKSLPSPLISPAPPAPPYGLFASSGHVAGCLRSKASPDAPSAPWSPPEPWPYRPAASQQLMARQPGRALRNPGRS